MRHTYIIVHVIINFVLQIQGQETTRLPSANCSSTSKLPTNLKASNVTYMSMDLEWLSPQTGTSFDFYNITRRHNTQAGHKQQFSNTFPKEGECIQKAHLKSFSPNTLYEIFVRACSKAPNSSCSPKSKSLFVLIEPFKSTKVSAEVVILLLFPLMLLMFLYYKLKRRRNAVPLENIELHHLR